MADLGVILIAVLLTALLSLCWVFWPAKVQSSGPIQDAPIIVIRNNILDFASPSALDRFPIALGAHSWQDLRDILLPEYPDFPDRCPTSESQDHEISNIRDLRQILQIKYLPDGATLSFLGEDQAVKIPAVDEEIETIRQFSDNLPYPAWKTDPNGKIVWQNETYTSLSLRSARAGCDASAGIFDLQKMSPTKTTVRAQFDCAISKKYEWFEICRTPLPDGVLYSATSIDPLIRAEEAQREFVQTLAKTFAHLSVGLAVFNRDRQLALFNPALTDLSGLSISFLSPRPTIDSFFDAMRENRRMPEPKNYKTWRQRMVDLIDEAESGRFEETWTLESGQSYNVKGRPHPDGAIAFLFEDISAEISLARNLRAELELGQNLVDTFEDALAVFSQSGLLTFSNKAYDVMWNFQTGTTFADVTIHDAIKLWKDQAEPNPLWQDIHDAVMALGEREMWTMPVCIKGQTPMQCKIVPIASGATVIRFSQQPTAPRRKEPRMKKNSG